MRIYLHLGFNDMFILHTSNILVLLNIFFFLTYFPYLAMGSARKSSPFVEQWNRFEVIFTSSQYYWDPVRDVQLQVQFTAPNGKHYSVQGFWDGGKIWKARFSPTQTGEWAYTTHCSKEDNSGLHQQHGKLICIPYEGNNPLYKHGPIQLSRNQRYFTHHDGTPFFWMGDTAWNGPLLADQASWESYLNNRKAKGFNTIQFVTTQWRGALGNVNGQPAFTGNILIQIRPKFFQRLDYHVDAINDHGMIAAPVILWAAEGDENPGYALPADQRIELANYLTARYGAHHVVWLLGGNGNYQGRESKIWQHIGRTVFGKNPHHLVTMLPSPYDWVGEIFRNEPWYSFVAYQSNNNDSQKQLRWLTEGSPSENWNNQQVLPVINLQSNYEATMAHDSQKPFNTHAVRRNAYWSLLRTPPAGITYGAHGVWGCNGGNPCVDVGSAGVNVGSAGVSPAIQWRPAINFSGSTHMQYLRDFFTSMEWWRLRPAQELIANQPGEENPSHFIAAAKSESGDIGVIYTPERNVIEIKADELKLPLHAKWYNPRTGKWIRADILEKVHKRLKTPGERDWVLYLYKCRRDVGVTLQPPPD